MTPEHSIGSISIFGGEYNAKTKTLREIAERFIPPSENFSRLIQPDNTVLIGPRGSGKTTLLSMLQGPALEIWPHPDGPATRRRVDYTGVLVPCDRAWAEQLRELAVSGDVAKRFSTALFVLHTLRCLAAAAATRFERSAEVAPHRRIVAVGAREEAELACHVARAWHIDSPVVVLADLEEELTDAISRLSELFNGLEFRPATDHANAVASEPLLHLSLVPSCLALITRFNRVVDDREGRWALLFDELELAPPHLADMVLQLLRGTDRRLLLKVSYAPYEGGLAGTTPHSPQEGQDYSVVRLFYANKRRGFPFTRQLLDRRLDGVPASTALGASGVIEDEDDDEAAAAPPRGVYSPGTPAYAMLARLCERDESFVRWLGENAIDIDTLDAAPEPLRARVRKVMPMVALRLEVRRGAGEPGSELRSRRNIDLYSGEQAFLAMMEANPRWLEHICDELFATHRPPVPSNVQSRVLRDAAEEFMSYLQILPLRGTHLGVDDAPRRLLERIGNYFRDAHLRGPFNSDAPGSVIVDDAVSASAREALQALVDRGALIEVPDRTLPTIGPLTGRRFRIAYLLAPLFQLPLRLDKSINLTTVLARARADQQLLLEQEEAP
jgi:energy-coupling factor transporter ATP-binding protein EcfA2